VNIAAGWYGKLPALGDFAVRRLPPTFVEAWDAWLAAGMAGWRAQADGQAWLDAYLAGPVQHFVAGPGIVAGMAGNPKKLPPLAWAGVLIPSVDQAGRYFPFTIAAPLQPQAAAGHAPLVLHWLRLAGTIATNALLDEWSADQVDAALAQLAETTVTPSDDAATEELRRLVGASLTAAGHVLWWHSMDDGGIELQRSQGLPQGAAFARLLSGLPITSDHS
jgi:type VI secretion system protein ImpM